MPVLINPCGGGAVASGLTQLWWFGAVGEPTTPQLIPNAVFTQVTTSVSTGPGFGSASLVEFDSASASARFNSFVSLGDMRWVRASGLWDVAAGVKIIELRFASSGSVGYRVQGGLADADYRPYVQDDNARAYQELTTLMTPFSFGVPADHTDMTMWVYQATGGAIHLSFAQLEVYGPYDANGQV